MLDRSSCPKSCPFPSISTSNYINLSIDIHEYTRISFQQHYSASATAPLNVIETGLQAYIALGIQKSKLILGVPWYRNRISIKITLVRTLVHDRTTRFILLRPWRWPVTHSLLAINKWVSELGRGIGPLRESFKKAPMCGFSVKQVWSKMDKCCPDDYF